MENSIVKAITVYVPGNQCNLRCGYCYITENFKKNRNDQKAFFNYPVEQMIKAFNPARIGGLAHITVIGNGETLIPDEVVPFVKGLLHYGHVVEVVTNGTLSKRIDELIDMPEQDLERLIVKCSLHWEELKRLNLKDVYFSNIRKVIKAGGSSYPFLVLSNEYMDSIDEIKETCIKELGDLPHCTPCIVANTVADAQRGGKAATNPECTNDFIDKMYEKFHSKVFLESVRFLNVDVKKVFCYAGKYSFIVNMDTGLVGKCHNVMTNVNFFKNIDCWNDLECVGCECGISSCSLQYDFFSMGLIPEVENVPTYAEIVCDRHYFFTDKVRELMNVKIVKDEYDVQQKIDFYTDIILKRDKEIDENKHILSGYKETINILQERTNYFSNIIKENETIMLKLNQAIERKENKKNEEEKNKAEEVLDVIDKGIISKEELKMLTYDHLISVNKIGERIENGKELSEEIIKTILSKALKENENIIKIDIETKLRNLIYMPVTFFCIENGEEIEGNEEKIIEMAYKIINRMTEECTEIE